MPVGAGLRFDVYEILNQAGKGGMGEVYRARDVRLGRHVAIKFVAAELGRDATAEARLEREARLASSLNHPGIVTVHDIGSYEDRRYVVMEWIDGDPLSTLILGGPPPLKQALGLAVQIAEALAAAHEAGVVHRDLKPANVMVTSTGRTKIVDFGLSRIFASADDSTGSGITQTQGPMLMGTAGYVAPEQIRGEPTGAQVDQFAFGAILYELLCGTRAFHKDTPVQTLSAILVDEPQPLESLRAEVPPRVAAIVRRCLQKEPSERYASTRDLALELRDISETMLLETRSLPRHRRGKLTSRVMAIAAAAIVILGAIGVWAVWPIHWPRPGSSAPAQPTVRHIVVLPFSNVTLNPDDQIFVDGLVETLTSNLSALEGSQQSLRIVPASEVRGQRITTAKDAHQSFGANLAITGAIQRLPTTTRLTLNLVDATALVQLSSRTIDLGSSREALTQDTILATTTALLALQLQPAAERALTAGGTSTPAAYELYVQARGLLQRFDRGVENVDRAIDTLSRAVTLDPEYVLAHSSLGEAYWRKYENDKQTSWIDRANASCERALAINNRVAPVHMTMALIARGRGRYEEAVVFAQRAVELDPVGADGYRELGRAYEALGRLQEAEATYQRAIAVRSDDWLVYNALGTFYFSQSRWQDAEAAYKRVTELTPDNTRGYNNLGAVYFRLGRGEDAARMWEHSIAIRPTPAATSNLGSYYYRSGRYADAAAAFERAVALQPNDRRLWRNLGAARYWAPGQRDQAAAAYEKAVASAEAERKVNPRQPGLLAELADSYSMLGKRAEALDAARAFENVGAADGEAIFNVASAYEQLGEREKALEFIGKALSAGYSRQSIEQSPGLVALRADPRFVRQMK